MQAYTPLAPHVIPEAAVEFLATMSEKERQLHELAIELLGSSYFVETSHGFKAWLKKARVAEKK